MIQEIAAIGSELSAIDSTLIDKQPSSDFGELLFSKLDGVNEAVNDAGNVLEDLAKGEEIAIHEAILAMQKAKKELSFMVEARNKLLEAYQEVMRMQI